MPLIATRDGTDAFVSGTAFVIAPGLALTAYPVLADFYARFEGVVDGTAPANASFEVLAYLIFDGGRTLPLKVQRVWRMSPSDLAVLSLVVEDCPNDHVFKLPMLDLLPPPVGTPISAFGFANGSVQPPRGEEPLKITLASSVTTGEVVEIHHQRRDSRLAFPCFRTNARFDGGMSGGPVFNNRTGKICGVICSSLPATIADPEHVSYASTLWPMVATMLDDPARPDAGQFPLLPWFANGTIRADHLSAVELVVQANGLMGASAKYNARAWERSA